jgi:hypothetical protein
MRHVTQSIYLKHSNNILVYSETQFMLLILYGIYRQGNTKLRRDYPDMNPDYTEQAGIEVKP